MNILVVRTDKLGDFITALPAIYLLKEYNKENKITLCVAPINEKLALACDFVDEVIVDNAQESVFALAKKLKNAKIEASITLFSNTRVAFAQFVAGIAIRIAPATKIAQIFYTNRVKQRRSEVKMAEFEYNIALVQTLFEGIGRKYPQPLLRLSGAKESYEVFCRQNAITKDLLAFHVGSGGSTEANWSLDEYAVLIKEVCRSAKYQVLLTFGPDEIALCEAMQEKLQGEEVVFYISQDGLVAFAKLLSHFKLFVSTSTGTYHLASLVGTPTLTFFGDSLFASPARWKSVGDERLQTHFMLPRDADKRSEVFARVKEKLSTL